jgi:hypothetical protein
MNLEAIEQRCLVYLQDVRKPLVPIARLLDVLREDEDCADVSEAELLAFLRKHELFTVIEPYGMAEDGNSEELESAGIMTTPNVMLATRVPSKTELTSALHEQMGTMLNALETALNQARNGNNPKLAMQVQAVLKRARELQQKLDDSGLT